MSLPDDNTLVLERDQRIAALGPRPPWWRFCARRLFDRRLASLKAMDVTMFSRVLREHYGPEALHEMMNRPPLLSSFIGAASGERYVLPVKAKES